MECVGPETIVAYLERRASPSERRALDEHVDACSLCRETVAALASLGEADPEPPAEPAEVVGRYELISLIGRGGMGSVYCAYDPELERRVAIKVLHEEILPGKLRSQWLAEAKAMARVADPNVVVVLDAGVTADAAYIVMELFEGTTLRKWMAEDRPWRDVLELMCRAGRGLAAAHAADLVHRDFKPDNVLVSAEARPRRVCVTDFGLAISDIVTESAPEDEASHESVSLPRLAGTVPYMAPEQLAGRRVGPAADQFAFCVTAFEALFGERPFRGATPGELLTAMRDPVRIRREGIPRRVTSALVRGLAIEPTQRHRSMAALLDRLGSPRARGRAWIMLGVGTAMIAGGTGVAVVDRSEVPAAKICDADRWLGATWSPDRLARLEAAGTSEAARATWKTVHGLLVDHVGELSAAYLSVCTRMQTEAHADLDRSLACLGARRARLDATLEAFTGTSAGLDWHSLEAARAFPSPHECLAPQDIAPPPPSIAARVDEIGEVLARAQGLAAAGERAAAEELVEAQLEGARVLEYAPLLAEALAMLATLLPSDEVSRAEALLTEAFAIAEAQGMDALAAKIQIHRVYVVGHTARRPDAAFTLARSAEAAIARAGGDPRLAAKLHYHVAGLLHDAGRSEAAEARASLGLESLAAAEASDPILLVWLLHIRGNARFDRGNAEEGLADLERAIVEAEATVGLDHPDSDAVRYSHARVLFGTGATERALEIFEALLAEGMAREGPRSAAVAEAHTAIGLVMAGLGRVEEAVAHHRACVDVWDALGPSPAPTAGLCMHNLGHAYSQLQRCDEAARWLTRARDELTRTVGADHMAVSKTWSSLGMCADVTGDLDTAADAYARALEIADHFDRPAIRGMTRLYLAQVLHAQGHTVRARELAQQAKTHVAGQHNPAMEKEVDAFLTSLDARPR